jgi:hypothetical protein
MSERGAPGPTSGRRAAPENDDAPTVHLAEDGPDEGPAPEPDPDATHEAPPTSHLRGARSHTTHRAGRPRRRLLMTVVVAVAAAGAIFAAGMMAAGSAPPAPTAAPVLPAVAPPILPSPATPTTASPTARTTTALTTVSSSRSSTRTSARATRPTADTSPGCGHRAVARGVFNPACSEYQGYLDPGRAAGRQPSSSDLQHDDGCQKGYIPQSEC